MAEINRLSNKEDAELSKLEQMEARAQRLFKELDTDGVYLQIEQTCMRLRALSCALLCLILIYESVANALLLCFEIDIGPTILSLRQWYLG